MARPKSSETRRLFPIRLLAHEKERIAEQADRARLTLSEYVRRRALGLRVVSRVEDQVLNELRRLGGLQKHLATQLPSYRPEFNAILRELLTAIKRIDSNDRPEV
jgi:hypothetical protein